MVSPPEREPEREGWLRHIDNTIRRSGPEVVEALNKSVPYFEDLHLASGGMSALGYTPTFAQGLWASLANSGDPEILGRIEDLALFRAKCDALVVLWDEEYEKFGEEAIALKRLALLPQKTGHWLKPPAPKLDRSMNLKALQNLAEDGVAGILDPSHITVEVVDGSLKKLKSFLVRLPAGPILTVMVALEFDSRAIWSDAVAISRPDMLPAPLITFMVISPANPSAWPSTMPMETRIVSFLRAMAMFARQIEQQSSDD